MVYKFGPDDDNTEEEENKHGDTWNPETEQWE